MTDRSTGPRCGNNPNYRMSEGDRKAVDDFKAYLADRAAIRDRIAEALYAQDHPSHLVPLNETGMEAAYRESADAVLAVLPPPADRASADRVRTVLETEAVVGRSALEYRGLIVAALMADEAQQQAGETPATTEAEPVSCAHCGKTVRRITGTLTAWWVHIPGGQAMCQPWQPARSTRATPKPAAGARQDGAQQP